MVNVLEKACFPRNQNLKPELSVEAYNNITGKEWRYTDPVSCDESANGVNKVTRQK